MAEKPNQGLFHQAQQERLEAYCCAMGWKNYQFYIDFGFSGSNLNRPQMQQLIMSTQAGRPAI